VLTGVEPVSGVSLSAGATKARDRQRFKILLVEDNSGDIGLIKEALRGRNRFELSCVDRFSAALAHLERSPVDVILLDLALPDSNGLDTLDKMRANAGSTPIVILTGSDDDDLAVSALRRGAQDYLVKGQVDGGLLARLLVYAIERWRAEERLSASETRADAILKTALDAIISMDCAGRIIEFNRAAETTFGHSRADVLGQSLADVLIPPALRDAHKAGLERYLTTGEGPFVGKRVELSALRRDGTEIPVELSVARVGSATPPTFTAFVRDISERKRAETAIKDLHDERAATAKSNNESALKIANDELEAFSYSVAHDLRAPLRGMNGFAQVLIDTYADKLDADGQDWLQEILLNARKMGALIDALLSLARVTRSELKRERVDLSAIVRAAAAQLGAADAHRSVELVVEDDVFADVDPQLARALVQNLLGNAWKFTANVSAARIEFGIAENKGLRAFFVRDNGAGFDMAFVGKLFGPFQRLHSEIEFSGTGIGLANVQRIVHRHGGRIWAEGIVNDGATFYFTLPAISIEGTS
jgi:PAS domain S-box-containing protein